MNPQELSNPELYAQVMNKELAADHRQLVVAEFWNRNFSTAQLDALSTQYNKNSSTKPFTLKDTLWPLLSPALIFFLIPGTAQIPTGLTLTDIFAFVFILQVLVANVYLKHGHGDTWKKYWSYLAGGYFLWATLTIFFGDYLYSQT